ncbi:hypothetical protein BX616_007506 [Lobosporangium transversale]|uniref:Uncharacterized protein n=1 Tax=Lobosporangium transversale TaxID=64571 RepID=A0A1Y2GD61_9FUNG|nr:hypothetical protein BCR41DRAFT_389190 [Lobosporangium transversale]KAF9914817.1 hypothetical protein BX616_007506 [Lobosporangium transversale]ORZ06560.1 hypothetical protein BCR41DRAFT_389190 [Lobosporangium transversale]|eukprot:XP_021877603.1 hypothetical protein BCR41DRAFT_389190 [Lobosporangium transversale]
MKVSTQFLAASAIALAATAMALPSLSKRIVDGSKVVGCFVSTFINGDQAWTAECATAAATDIGLVRAVNLQDLNIDFRNPDPMALGLSSSGFNMDLLPLPKVSWPIEQGTCKVTVINDGVAIAEFIGPSTSVEMKGATLGAVIRDTFLNILPGQEDGFTKFAEALISEPSHAFTITGNADVTLRVPSIPAPKTLTATNIAFSSLLTLQTCNNFPMEPIGIVSYTRDPASGGGSMVYTIKVHNPSQLTLKLGDSKFNVLYTNGDYVATAEISDLSLFMGENIVTATLTSTDPNIFDALTSQANTFIIAGFEGSVKHPLMAKAMRVFRSQITIPKIEVA